MFDTHAIARSLTDADLTPAQADAITDAIRQAAEHGDHVTSDQFKAGLAELRTDIASIETRIYRAMLIQMAATIGGTVALLRLLGE